MKTLVSMCVAVILFAGLIEGTIKTQIGQPISDAQALSICGGCDGAKQVNCPSGDVCGTGTFFTIGHGTLKDVTGSETCGGSIHCASGWENQKECAPGD